MKLYNTMSMQKEEFVPIEPGKVRMYACGPTVYNYIHVGNARPIIMFDVLRRYLEYRGYEVTFVQNFTDVDDKIIKRANEEGISSEEVAKKYIAEYFTDAHALGVREATVHPKATENIQQIIDLITTLIDKGYAYEVNGDVYYRTLKFKDYGKLSHQPIEDLQSGARIDVNDIKENPLDFALWKAAKPGEPSWDSPWGKGRPGWHIECSAMSNRYLGKTIDIHCGGSDLAFPHHENEIAQSEAANGCKFVNYWLHNGFINIDNKKMSKSLGNFFTVREAAAVYGYDCIRMFMLMSHYRSPLNYSGEILMQAKAALERLRTAKSNLEFFIANGRDGELSEADAAFVQGLDQYREKFDAVMDDDFNTADAISVIFEMVREINTAVSPAADPSKTLAQACLDRFLELCDVLGIPFGSDSSEDPEAKAIEELGEPAKVAAQILADYRELTAVPHAQPIKEKRRWRGISPLLLIVLVLLAIPIGLPLVFGAGATVLGVLLAIVVTVLAVIFAVLLILYGIPLALICGGAVIALLSCTLWATPANALVTLGNGLAAFAAGILLGLLSIKLSILFVPPVFRAFVAVLRAPFNWIRNRCRRTGGGNV